MIFTTAGFEKLLLKKSLIRNDHRRRKAVRRGFCTMSELETATRGALHHFEEEFTKKRPQEEKRS